MTFKTGVCLVRLDKMTLTVEPGNNTNKKGEGKYIFLMEFNNRSLVDSLG